jgi:hypothetical protein
MLTAKTTKPLWKQYINHQSTFYHKSFLGKNRFDNHYTLCADFELLINAHFNGENIIHVPKIISVRKGGGVSDINRIKAWKEKHKVLSNYLGPTTAFTFCYKKITLEYVKSTVKYFLPPAGQKTIRRMISP